jgi:MSHA pilin protein MshD
MSIRSRAGGLSLIELIIFIVVVAIAVTGVLIVLTTAARSSSDPAIRKQMLVIAESLLEEVELMPFTYCDPDDTSVLTATSTAGCTVASNAEGALSPQASEARGSLATPYDNVWDYNAFSITGITDITGTAIPGLSGYRASVSVAAAALSTITLASGDAVLITVTVTAPNGDSIALSGYRTRYAPNSP